MADTKIIFCYQFGTPLEYSNFNENFPAVKENWFLMINLKNDYKDMTVDIKELETNSNLFNIILTVMKPINNKKIIPTFFFHSHIVYLHTAQICKT